MKSFRIVLLLLPTILFNKIHGQGEHFVNSEGVNIHYTTFGAGPPILIINGGPGFSSEGFIPLAKEIAKEGYQTILYDQRGTGQSTMKTTDSSNITMDLMVNDIEAIRKELKIDKWTVLGHSFGGMMANYYAAQHPSHVKAMISSSSGGIDLALLGNARTDLYSKLTQTEIDSMNYWRTQMQEGNNYEFARKQFAKFMAPAYVYNRKFIPVVAERLTQGNLSLNHLVWDDLIRIGFDCKQELRSFNQPVLIIQGKNDIISKELAYTADSVFSNSQVVLLDSCSHYGWLDQPEQYFGAIFRFLKNVEERSASENQVRQVLENYVNSIYATDSALVESIADSSLQKSGHYYSFNQKKWSYENMDFEGLQHTAATYNRKKLLPDWAPAEIEIYEVKEKIASAKVKAIWGFDYILLSKKDDRWIIDKVLWQSYSPEERKHYFIKLKSLSEEDKTSQVSFPDIQEKTLYRGAFSPDGNHLYFFKKTGAGESYGVFKGQYENGNVTQPKPVNLGVEASDLYPTVSSDGKKLVFTSYRKSPEEDWSENAYLWYSELMNDSSWSKPRFLQHLNVKGKYHSNPAFTSKGHLVYRVTETDWNSSTTFIAELKHQKWASPKPYTPVEQWKDSLSGYYLWGGIPGPENKYVILDVSEIIPGNSRGPSDLWLSYSKPEGWSEPRPLGLGINRKESWDNFPFFSPDGETLYFTRDFSKIHYIRTSDFLDQFNKS